MKWDPFYMVCLRGERTRSVVTFLQGIGAPAKACPTFSDAQAVAQQWASGTLVVETEPELSEAAACVAVLRAAHPGAGIVVVGCPSSPQVVAILMSSGADDVIAVDCPLREVAARIGRFFPRTTG